MKTMTLQPDLTVSAVALGCMRLAAVELSKAEELIDTALEAGITYFDHADIYGDGESERRFGQVLARRPSLRERMLVQTKCGIRPGRYDFSKEHIIASAEGSLKRLGVDRLDALLLHRPDTLMEPEEVAEAFDNLHSRGLVRYFGVSNHSAGQMRLLGAALSQPLLFNQLQFGPAHTGLVDVGLHVNMTDEGSVMHDDGLLEYCRLHRVTIQPWSPFQRGFIAGPFFGSGQYPALEETLSRLAAEKGATPTALTVAWILRHPARMQPVVGTMNPDRLRQAAAGAEVPLSREEWYEIYRAAGNTIP